MNIFELTENAKILSQMIDEQQDNETEDKQALIDTLEMTEDSINLKLDNIGWLIAETEVKQKAYEEQEAKFKREKDKAKKKVEQLKELISYVLHQKGLNKLETDNYKYSFRKSTATKVLDLEVVPAEFLKEKVTVSADLTKIKKYIQEHGAVEWAVLEEKQSLQVK